MGEELAVRTVGLGKTYGATVALQDVDLTIGRGEVLGYLGPNGAGKTTTLRLLMGMLRPTAGRATVVGLDAWRDAVAVHRRVGYLPASRFSTVGSPGASTCPISLICGEMAMASGHSCWQFAWTWIWIDPRGNCRRATGRSWPSCWR